MLENIKVLVEMSLPDPMLGSRLEKLVLKASNIRYIDLERNQVVLKDKFIENSDEDCNCELETATILEVFYDTKKVDINGTPIYTGDEIALNTPNTNKLTPTNNRGIVEYNAVTGSYGVRIYYQDEYNQDKVVSKFFKIPKQCTVLTSYNTDKGSV